MVTDRSRRMIGAVVSTDLSEPRPLTSDPYAAMQLGFVSAIFDQLPFENVLNFASAEHFQCVEVMCWPEGGPDRRYGGVRHLGVEGFTQAQADHINEMCATRGVTISGLGYYSNPLSSNHEEAVHAL